MESKETMLTTGGGYNYDKKIFVRQGYGSN